MDFAKKSRRIHRTAFTKNLNSFREKCSNQNTSEADRVVAWQILEAKIQQLEEANMKYIDLLIVSDIAEEDVEEDIESYKRYKLEFLMARMDLNDHSSFENEPRVCGAINVSVPHSEKSFKGPTLEKAFNSLKNPIGRDELLVDYYTRELLSLVLQSITNKGRKTSVSDDFEKISAHIRALETLGVSTDYSASMLYLLVESSLPE